MSLSCGRLIKRPPNWQDFMLSRTAWQDGSWSQRRVRSRSSALAKPSTGASRRIVSGIAVGRTFPTASAGNRPDRCRITPGAQPARRATPNVGVEHSDQ